MIDIRNILGVLLVPAMLVLLLLVMVSPVFAQATNGQDDAGSGGQVTEAPVDTDGDGLSDEEENTHGTDIDNPDTDGDGLEDGPEVNTYKTDPNKADSDGDGLDDGEEVNEHKTDPNKADSDGDGLDDGEEVNEHKTDPNKADSDDDGLGRWQGGRHAQDRPHEPRLRRRWSLRWG